MIKKNKKNGLEVDSKVLFNRLRNIEKDIRVVDKEISQDKDRWKLTREWEKAALVGFTQKN